MNWWIRIVLTHPWKTLVAAGLLTALVGASGVNLRFDGSTKSFILNDDPDYRQYREYRQKFGQDEILVVAFEDENIFAPENIQAIRRLTERIGALDNVHDVRSLTNVEYMRNSAGSFDVTRVIREIPETTDDYLRAQRQVAVSNPILRQDIVSPDGRKTSLLITLAATEDGYRYEKEIEAIRRIVDEESRRLGKPMYFSGERYVDHRFVEYMRRDLRIFIPLTCLALTALLYLILRNVRETAIGMIAMSACLIWVMGLIPMTGWTMNAVTAGLPSLILCIAVSDVVHLMHRYRALLWEAKEPVAALAEAMREVVWPCLLTVVMTVVGFGSLMFNHIRLIQGFGFLAVLGLGISFMICMTMVPALLTVWKDRPGRARARMALIPERWLSAWAGVIVRRRGAVAGTALALVALMVAGIAGIKIQANRLLYLKAGSDTYQAIRFVDENLAGTTELDIWIESGKEGTFKEPWALQKVEGLAAFLRAQPEIDKVISINDFIKDMSQAFYEDNPEYYRLPEKRTTVAEFLLLYSMSGSRNELDRYTDYDCSRTRLSVRTSEQNSAVLDDLIGRMRAYLASHFESPLDARIASVAIANNNVFRYMVTGFLSGLVPATLLMGLLMCVFFRSIAVGVLSLLPNVLPIVACLGVMGWMDIWLEIPTVMTFSIALGIATDDTIHFVSHFQDELRARGDRAEALRRTMREMGSAMIETNLVVIGGFLILAFASLKMTILFGALSAFILVVAMAFELSVTPLCLLSIGLFRSRRAAAKDARHDMAERWEKTEEAVG